MANKTFVEIASGCEKVATETLESVRKALSEGNLVAYNERMSKLKKVVSEWNSALCNVDYAKLLNEENPMIAAVKQF